MHLQEIFDLPSTSCDLCTTSLMLLHTMVKEKIHLQENTLFDLDLGVKVTQNAAQYSRHHVTYAPAKFDIATSDCLGEDAYTRKYII